MLFIIVSVLASTDGLGDLTTPLSILTPVPQPTIPIPIPIPLATFTLVLPPKPRPIPESNPDCELS